LKSLQSRLEGSGVLQISFSVDPEHDTPQILGEYARRFGADADRWWFLTGPRRAIYELIQNRFRLSVMENPAVDPEGKTEAIAHSDRLALIDRGRVVGLFDSNDPEALTALVSQAKLRSRPDWVRVLPGVNASLNALCALLLLTGWSFIRGREKPAQFVADGAIEPPSWPSPKSENLVRGHILCMILAIITSALFLTCYLIYHFQAGSVPFRGQGMLRLIYFTVLISHTFLATFCVVPLVLLTLIRAVRRQFARHRSIAAVTLPIWLYVSVTGVVIYLMLYQLPASLVQST
jgi:protein SCO1/2/putative membrane protein